MWASATSALARRHPRLHAFQEAQMTLGAYPTPLPEPDRRRDDGKDQIEHLAMLVADGKVPFPIDWPPDRQATLAVLVRARRRDRLLKLIARMIADDLLRPGPQESDRL
jgi:hypothetical protein